MNVANEYISSVSKGIKVRRCFKRSLLKYLVQIFFVYALTAIGCAWADSIRHGTYFSIYVSDDFVSTSIDSREKTVSGNFGLPTYRDDFCKILILDETTIFITEGVISGHMPLSGIAFDAQDLASALYKEQTPAVDLSRLATGWGTAMAYSITNIYPFYVNEINRRHDGEISQAFFIRVQKDKAQAIKVVIQKQGLIAPVFTPIVTFVGPNSLILSGHIEILSEFSENKESARAKILGDETMNRVSGRPNPEIWAAKTEMYVKAVRDWSNDIDVGGEIATIILERGKKRNWFHRPSFCPEG